jgi:hypothetical protein
MRSYHALCQVWIVGCLFALGCAPGGTGSRGGDDPPIRHESDGGADGGFAPPPSGLSAHAEIDAVALLQPIEIALVEGGAAVAPDAPIYADRATMIRVGVRFDAASPQTIRAVADLDGAVFEDTRTISRSSIADDEESNFWIRVPASAVRETTTIRVRLEGEGRDSIDTRGSHRARWPSDGSSAPLGASLSAPLRLVLVPVHHTPSGERGLARVSPAQLERFHRVFAANFPVSHSQLTVELRSEPVSTSGTAAVVGDTVPFVDRALDDVEAAWTADGASRNTIYVGLLQWDAARYPCDGQCGSGLARGWTLSDLAGRVPLVGVVGAWSDVSGGPWMPDYVHGWVEYNGLPPEAVDYVGDGIDVAIYQALHEASHTLTLGHAPCGNSDPDPAYPVPTGQLDTWAYDSAVDVVRPPAMHFDFMTYCGPPGFVSRFTYLKLDAAIRAINR